MDDEITEKVNTTLNNATEARDQMTTTIDGNKKVIKEYEDAHKEFDAKMEQIADATFRAQAAKYKGTPNYVEPNLTKRLEAKRERARLRALASCATETYSDMGSMMSESNAEKMYASLNTSKLERVNEEAEDNANHSFKGHNFGNRDGNPISLAGVGVPANIQQVLATPTPKLNDKSKLTQQDTQRVLGRQLTMQLMPMYRVRQRSAGLKPPMSTSQTVSE